MINCQICTDQVAAEDVCQACHGHICESCAITMTDGVFVALICPNEKCAAKWAADPSSKGYTVSRMPECEAAIAA